MAKLTNDQQFEISQKYDGIIRNLISSGSSRNILYDLRKGFFDGTIRPTVERNHDVVCTQYAATIVERFAAYAISNGFVIKIKPEDISDESQVMAAEMLNRVIDKMYNENDEFLLHCYNLFFYAGLYGDGYLGTDIKDGIPSHYSILQPQNIFLRFDDDNYNSFNAYMYERGVDTEVVKNTYGIDASPYALSHPGYTYGSINTHENPYGLPKNGNFANQSYKVNFDPHNMSKVTVFHDFINKKRIQFVNDMPIMADSTLENLYHLVGNFDPNNPYGISDFETVSNIITKLEEKLGEESDAATGAVHHKILTDQNVQEIQQRWDPRKTQAFRVPNLPQPGRFEILNTAVNTYPMGQYIDQLMNILRTGSGLQELGQDTISANVSGRAIAYMFQGVTQKIKTKRIRFNTIVKQMVIDDMEILAKNDKDLRDAAFENGTFRLKIDVKYPPVLEQDEQIRISNLQTMTAGGLISKYSARLHLSDYIDDPSEEAKKIQSEKEEEIMNEQKLQRATQPQASAQSVAPAEMGPEAIGGEGTGQVSTEGNAGTALTQASAGGIQNQMIQNQTGQQF